MKLLNIIGLSLSFVGSLFFVKNYFISNKKAIELGTSKWAHDTDTENIKLPAVRDRINQRLFSIWGASLLAIGFFLQLLSQIF